VWLILARKWLSTRWSRRRKALSLEEGDRLVFRVEGDHAVPAQTPDR